jgi:uridine kinase
MEGDKLLIGEDHTARATELCVHIHSRLVPRMVITVAGESGAGKSETASEIVRLLGEQGHSAQLVQQDDYFVFPPKTNHEMRRRNIEQVGLYEVKLGLLDSNLRSYKRGENPIYRPLVNYDADRITMCERDLEGVEVVVAEGTYTTRLAFADLRIFIARNYEDTAAHRKARGRDAEDAFIGDVLLREHEIIRQHRQLADYVISRDFKSISTQPKGQH